MTDNMIFELNCKQLENINGGYETIDEGLFRHNMERTIKSLIKEVKGKGWSMEDLIAMYQKASLDSWQKEIIIDMIKEFW